MEPKPHKTQMLATQGASQQSVSLPKNFARLSGTDKLRILTETEDLPAVFKALRNDEVFHLVRDIGIEDAFELLPFATKEQRQTFVDLAIWRDAALEPAKFDQVMGLALAESWDFAVQFVNELGPETIALRIFSKATVYTQEEAENVSIPDDVFFNSPDGVFLVVCNTPDDVAPLRQLMELLYASGVEEAHSLIQAGRRDTIASIADQAEHFREARLEDVGFPRSLDRFSLFEPIVLAELKQTLIERIEKQLGKISARTAEGTALGLQVLKSDSKLFFWKALAIAEDSADISGYIQEMTLLVNRVFAAVETDPMDSEAWKDASDRTLSFMSLGLQELSQNSLETAADLLIVAWPAELFKAGVQVVRPAHIKARSIIGKILGSSQLSLFGEEIAASLTALAAFLPMIGQFVGSGFQIRNFQTTQDADWAKQLTARADFMVRFAMDKLGYAPGTNQATAGLVKATFENILATAWARNIIDGAVSLEPLDSEDVKRLLVAAFDGQQLRPKLKELEPVKLGLTDEADAVYLEYWMQKALQAVELALSSLNPSEPIKTRFIGNSLLVK